jgi:hypothetical protein
MSAETFVARSDNRNKKIVSKQNSGNNNPEIFSELSMTLESADPNDFYLRPPEKNSANYLKCKIFFFNTP